MEKNKVNKIDVSGKDDIINDLKSKINNLKTGNDKLNTTTIDEKQKLTEEIKKKDKTITILKRNNETLKKELQLYQNNNDIENKNKKIATSNELIIKDK